MPVELTCTTCQGTGLLGNGESCDRCGGDGSKSPVGTDELSQAYSIAAKDQLDQMEPKLDALDTKMDTIDTHLDTIEAKIDALE